MNDLSVRVVSLVIAAAIAALAGPPVAGAATRTLGLSGWQVQSSASAGNDGAAVSRPGFAANGWLKVTPDDGGAPGTEVEALVQNGRCPHVFFSTNMKRCFGYMKSIGADTIPRFAVPWWFRTTFRAAPGPSATRRLSSTVSSARPTCGSTATKSPAAARSRGPTPSTPTTSPGSCDAGPTRWPSACSPTTRTRCSRWTTSTGRRSRPTTTPASSSRWRCTRRRPWRSATPMSSRTTRRP